LHKKIKKRNYNNKKETTEATKKMTGIKQQTKRKKTCPVVFAICFSELFFRRFLSFFRLQQQTKKQKQF